MMNNTKFIRQDYKMRPFEPDGCFSRRSHHHDTASVHVVSMKVVSTAIHISRWIRNEALYSLLPPISPLLTPSALSYQTRIVLKKDCRDKGSVR